MKFYKNDHWVYKADEKRDVFWIFYDEEHRWGFEQEGWQGEKRLNELDVEDGTDTFEEITEEEAFVEVLCM